MENKLKRAASELEQISSKKKDPRTASIVPPPTQQALPAAKMTAAEKEAQASYQQN